MGLIKELCYKVDYYNEENIDSKLEMRLNLFYKIFYSKLGDVAGPTLHFHLTREGFSKQTLFFRLIYSIFQTYVLGTSSIESILTIFLSLWYNAIEKNRINVIFMIPFPRVMIPKEDNLRGKDSYEINEDISLKWNVIYNFYKLEGTHSMSYYSYILYKTVLSFDFYKTGKEQNEKFMENNEKFKKEWDDKLKSIQEIICSFYINDIKFKSQPFIIKFPWWFEPKYKEYLKLDHKAEGLGTIISENIMNKVANIYPKIVKTEIFSNDKFIILWLHYRQLFKREFIPDMLLDLFIIFEYLFGKGVSSEITFRLSINIALFLAKDIEEFEEIYIFFKKTYSVRSTLAHGGDWMKVINKIINKYDRFEKLKDIFEELINYVNLSLKKIIILKETNPNIMNEMKEIYFLKNSELVVK